MFYIIAITSNNDWEASKLVVIILAAAQRKYFMLYYINLQTFSHQFKHIDHIRSLSLLTPVTMSLASQWP